MTEYREAPEVEMIGERLVRQYHAHLLNCYVRYIFKEPASKTGGKVVLGKARKISGLPAYLSRSEANDTELDEYFVVEIAGDMWRTLSNHQQIALVDHELSHCSIEIDEETDEIKLIIRPHDVEEFVGVAARHGAWDDVLYELQDALNLYESDHKPLAVAGE